MPECHTEPQPFLHGLPQDDLIGIVEAESKGVLAAGPLVLDVGDVWKVLSRPLARIHRCDRSYDLACEVKGHGNDKGKVPKAS